MNGARIATMVLVGAALSTAAAGAAIKQNEGAFYLGNDGRLGVVVVVGGVAALSELARQTDIDALAPLVIAGALTPAGGNPAASPAATLSVTVTRNGAALTSAVSLLIAFLFPATETPTFGAPTQGALLGGAQSAQTIGGEVLVQTNATGTFTGDVTLPAGAPRTVTVTRFTIQAFDPRSTPLQQNGVVFGGP